MLERLRYYLDSPVRLWEVILVPEQRWWHMTQRQQEAQETWTRWMGLCREKRMVRNRELATEVCTRAHEHKLT
ncbi:hypothetical protein Y1Q_0010781 [Alligator mississippiensis]|uniref:Uncharacterized protein n=1 Tax=Alligator mississippiensis TaxID=8496 RepID=A0A151M6U5_ALLMI|nr:hypothetical protein Y1Q_0010781 [Alligator mississippiensis]